MTQKTIKKTKNIKKSKHNNQGYKKIVFVIVLILVSFIIIKNRQSKKAFDITQMIINNENITQELHDSIIQENDNIYLSYEDIKNFFDPKLYTEEKTNSIITTSDRKLAVINIEKQTMKINNSNVETDNIIINRNGTIYINISEMDIVYNLKIEKIDRTNVITIDMLDKKSIKAFAKKRLKIKENTNILAIDLSEVKKGDWVYLINEDNKYAKVRTQDGIIGYVKKKKLNNYINEREDLVIEEKSFQEEKSISKDVTKEDLSTYEKRQDIIDKILHEAIKNDKMYVKISYNGKYDFYYDRFKIEIVPMLKECGIEIKFENGE